MKKTLSALVLTSNFFMVPFYSSGHDQSPNHGHPHQGHFGCGYLHDNATSEEIRGHHICIKSYNYRSEWFCTRFTGEKCMDVSYYGPGTVEILSSALTDGSYCEHRVYLDARGNVHKEAWSGVGNCGVKER